MAALLPAAPARPESRGPGLIGGPRRSGLRDREIADFEVQVRASDAPIVVISEGAQEVKAVPKARLALLPAVTIFGWAGLWAR